MKVWYHRDKENNSYLQEFLPPQIDTILQSNNIGNSRLNDLKL